MSFSAVYLDGQEQEHALEFLQTWKREIAAQALVSGMPFSIYYGIGEKRLQVGINQAEKILADDDNDLILWAKDNPKPTGIVSLRNHKVLFMNRLMPGFTGLSYDEIAVPDIRTQFKHKKATNLSEWTKRLVACGSTTEPIVASGTSGRFGSYQGNYSTGTLYGVPVRISEYEDFVPQ